MITWKREEIFKDKASIEMGLLFETLQNILTQEQADQLVDAIVQMSPQEYLQQLQTAKKALTIYGPGNVEMEAYIERLDQEIAIWESQL